MLNLKFCEVRLLMPQQPKYHLFVPLGCEDNIHGGRWHLQMDEVDYDVRMVAYQQLLPEAWATMARWKALPLLYQSLADLRDADDLALRHAAAQVCPD